jgi:UDP-glucose 4-epimerase
MIVVTGANGIIGRAVVAQLLAEGIAVEEISRDIFDLSNGNNLVSLIGERPDAVIHLAAAVPHSFRYPDTDASAELTRRIDCCVFNAARAWNCRIVYASTCSLYDKRSDNTMFEDSPILVRLDSPYMKAKNQGEALFAKLPSYAVMRVPAPIGPGLPTTVVARRFFDLATAAQPIHLWGSGKREQNYVDVKDIADVMTKAATSEANGTFNIAADAPTTMLTLATAIVTVLGRGSVEFAGVTDPLEDARARYSNKRARDLLSWRPKIALENSIRSMQEAK